MVNPYFSIASVGQDWTSTKLSNSGFFQLFVAFCLAVCLLVRHLFVSDVGTSRLADGLFSSDYILVYL